MEGVVSALLYPNFSLLKRTARGTNVRGVRQDHAPYVESPPSIVARRVQIRMRGTAISSGKMRRSPSPQPQGLDTKRPRHLEYTDTLGQDIRSEDNEWRSLHCRSLRW